jgi:hypothetical protein
MFSIFNKKKNEQSDERDDVKKQRSLDDFESNGTEVLSWDDMGKIEGGKSKNKPLNDLPGLQFTFGGTIPQ